jgi:hypothetical protein
MFSSATCWNGCRRLSDYDISTLSAIFVISGLAMAGNARDLPAAEYADS